MPEVTVTVEDGHKVTRVDGAFFSSEPIVVPPEDRIAELEATVSEQAALIAALIEGY